MKILGFIPARSGSKRIPKKNIIPLAGKPLIAYTILAAKSSKYVDRVVVSTDSEEIAATATAFGAEVPFLRPEHISGPDSTELEFFDHALNWFSEHERYEPDLIVLLYPTSPLRTATSIDRAIELMIAHPEADSLRSIKVCSEHPYKMWTIENGLLRPFIRDGDSNVHTLSYHLFPRVYIQNASIYITKPSTLKEKRSPIGDVIVPFVMDDIESIDINGPLDLELAELIMTKRDPSV